MVLNPPHINPFIVGLRSAAPLSKLCAGKVGVWECHISAQWECGSVSFQNWWECAQNKWECGSVSFQIGGSVHKNEWECGSVSFQIGSSVWPVRECGSGSVAGMGVWEWKCGL